VNIEKHLSSYVQSLRAKGDTERHCKNVRRLVTTVFTACRFRTLGDVKREAVERWLSSGEKAGRSARTRNSYIAACKWLLNWCVENELLLTNPLARIKPANEDADRRRQPRALTENELVLLLDAARRRPLAQALLFNKGWRKNQPGARIRPETRTRLEVLGYERALVYRTLVLTGLRLGELASIRICDVVLDGSDPHIVLDARNEKNRQGSLIQLRPDLADDLRRWIEKRGPGSPTPSESQAAARMRSKEPLFAVSPNLVKVFNRDLTFAGIEKRDERGRTACVHSLRHSFATLMSRGGVAPRVAQAAMRHASLSMTMSVYTDPKLLDVAGALRVLPALPLDAALAATGTEHPAP
jgi:integrase